MKKLSLILISVLLILTLAACSDKCEHTYDNACDATCNECGETREVSAHDYAAATCTAPKTCKICGATEGEALGHTWTNADCDTPKTCTVCGEVTTLAGQHNIATLLGEIEKLQIQINCLNEKHIYTDGVCVHCEYACPHEAENSSRTYSWSEDRFKCTATLECDTCNIDKTETVTPVVDTVGDEYGEYYVRANFETVSLEEQSLLSYAIVNGEYEVRDAHGLYAWNAATQNDPSTNASVLRDIVMPTDNITVTDGIPSASNWTPVGSLDNPFTGTFYGSDPRNSPYLLNDRIISGLRINGENSESVGFFGYNAGNVLYLEFEDICVYGGNDDANYVGAAVGVNLANGEVLYGDIHSGKITAKNGTTNYVGGVVGYNQGGAVKDCGASADIISDGVAGGVVGFSSSDGIILGCYHIGTVIGKENAGGVCGYAEQSTIVACYHIGTTDGDGIKGGIIGGKTLCAEAANYWQDDAATTANGTDNENATQVTDGDWLAILSQFNAEITVWHDSNSTLENVVYIENKWLENVPFDAILQLPAAPGKKK